MATKSDPTPAEEPAVDADADDESAALGSRLYKLALAGVGAIVLAQEEIETMIRRLVERGDVPAEEEEKLVSETNAAAARERKSAGRHIEATVGRVLSSLSVPSRADVDAIAERIDALAVSVQSLVETRRNGR